MKIIFSLLFLLVYLSCDDSFNKNVLIENFNKPIETSILQNSIQKQIDQYILEHPYYVYEEVPVEVKIEIPVEVPIEILLGLLLFQLMK
jgi:hypothetical protein